MPAAGRHTVTADGQRFLFSWPKDNDDAGQVHVILNWLALEKTLTALEFGRNFPPNGGFGLNSEEGRRQRRAVA